MTDRPALSRRHFLWQAGGGLGGIALAWMLDREARAGERETTGDQRPHFTPRARRVVQIFCAGGVSHVGTLRHKPDLARHHGEELTGKGPVDTFFGQPGRLMKSPFAFRRRGKSGLWVSDLLPHLAGCVDDMTFLYSMVAKTSNHTPATFQMNTGFTMNGFPCLGAWLSYGLGSDNQDLPAFVVLPDPRGLPAAGAINWTNGFLPAAPQGVAFRPSGEPIPDLFPPKDVSAAGRRAGMDLLAKMNQEFLDADPCDSTLAARIRS